MVRPTIRQDLRRFVRALRDAFGDSLISVVLFGSHARGEARRDSDIDLLIIHKRWPKGRLARRLLVRPLYRKVGKRFARPAQSVLLTPTEARRNRWFYLDLTEDAVFFFDRSGFFADVLERLRDKLRALGSYRTRDEEGNRYWVVLPNHRPGVSVEL